MDGRHLIAAARHVETNPVRAGLCGAASDWPWSSVRSHLADSADGLTDRRPLLELVPDWAGFLAQEATEADVRAFHTAIRTGRPLCDASLVDRLEAELGRHIRPQKRGPKPGWRRRLAGQEALPEISTASPHQLLRIGNVSPNLS
jgi:putative transposase